jgi:steroid 5-alpha reductase family enzyme
MLAELLGYDRFQFGFYLSLGVGAVAFLRSSQTNNYSFVDRSWSIVPAVYSWIFSDVAKPRTLVMSSLITLWGIRLTLNFVRKGGYQPGEQDYRWPIVRKFIKNPFLWHLFNLGFISFYQCILLMLLPVPTYIASLVDHPWGVTDSIATALFLAFLAGETIADNQQWDFQTKKYELLKTKPLEQLPEPYNVGFCTTGLFRYSRHPNFFCENMIWWTMTLFGWEAAKQTDNVNFLFLGCGLLTGSIFIGSTILTEWITSQKYPKYKEYQKCVPFLIPWFPKPLKFKKE